MNPAEGPLLPLFAGFGIELEYMIVRRGDLAVLPATDEVLRAVAGEYVSEIEQGALAWSNELVLHVIELKTNGPAASLAPLPAAFGADVRRINALLEGLDGRLMPTAMHPWMDPLRETRLWPHEYNPIYTALDAIFGCRGHGWSNLQSMHLNLPFADDGEFARLHTAIRLLLPVLPALAASSPVTDGRPTGLMDSRLEAYRVNCRRIPSITGHVIPEMVTTREEYQARVLEPMYRDIAPCDPGGVLRHEWLNARGAIARFDRNAIEIRVLDVQECPLADLAIAALTVSVLQALVAQRWEDLARQQSRDTAALEQVLLGTLARAEAAVIEDRDYLAAFGWPGAGRCTAQELWQHLLESAAPAGGPWQEPLRTIVGDGCLARRILRALGAQPSPAGLAAVYGELCDCLADNRLFTPPA